jgi:hypothetical protein
MNEVRIKFNTGKSIEECSNTFQQAVKASYGGARKLLRGVSVIRGSDAGGVEFFTPEATPFSGLAEQPSWKAGAWIPGYSKMHGAGRMAVQIYVLDHGSNREVQLVGPYSMGEKGSTQRLLENISGRF